MLKKDSKEEIPKEEPKNEKQDKIIRSSDEECLTHTSVIYTLSYKYFLIILTFNSFSFSREIEC